MIRKINKILSKFILVFTILLLIINAIQIIKPNNVQAQASWNIDDKGFLNNGKVEPSYAYGTMFFTDDTQVIGYIDNELCKKEEGIMVIPGLSYKADNKDEYKENEETGEIEHIVDQDYKDMRDLQVPKYYYEEQSFGQMYNNNTADNYEDFRYAKKRVLSNYMPPYEGYKSNKIYVYGLKSNQDLKLKITNCAIDKDGDLCDVECDIEIDTSINNIDTSIYNWNNYDYGYLPFNNWLGRDALHVLDSYEYYNYLYSNNGLNLGYNRYNYYSQYLLDNRERFDADRVAYGGRGPGEQEFNLKEVYLKDIPRALVTVTNDNGLVSFSFNTNHAKGSMSFKYYKSGSNTKANLDTVCSVIDDIDVIEPLDAAIANLQTNKKDALRAFGYEGNEAVSISNGEFYNFNRNNNKLNLVDNGRTKTVYRNRNGGVNFASVSGITYDILPSTDYSVLMTQNRNNDGTFKFSYQAAGCGIGWKFLVPYEIDIPAPIKKIDNINGNNDYNSPYRVYEEQEFTYTISQFIPNNYFIYNELPNGQSISELYGIKNKIVKEIKIEDQFNNNLTCSNDIIITNEKGEKKTYDFNIEFKNGLLEVSAKDKLKYKSFYNHNYTIIVKAKIDKDKGKVMTEPISNKATLYIKYSETDIEHKDSNIVFVDTKYNLHVHIIVRKTNEYGDIIDSGNIAASTDLTMDENKIDSKKDPNKETERYYKYVYRRGQSVTTLARWYPKNYQEERYGIDKVSIRNYNFYVNSQDKWSEQDINNESYKYYEEDMPYIDQTQQKKFNDIMNENIGHEIIIESSKLVDILGNVWQDGDNDNLLNHPDNEDKMVNGIFVRLLKNSGDKLLEYYTSDGGIYKFPNLSSRKLYEGNYKIKFEYDGFTWDAVEPKTNEKDGSKAIEDSNSRRELNEAFPEVTGQNQVINYKGDKTLTYSKFDDGTVKLNNACDREQQGQTINVKRYGDLNIEADTKESYLYNLYKHNNSPNEINNINLGLREREQTDLELITDIYRTNLHMNNSYDVKNYEGKIYINNDGMPAKNAEDKWSIDNYTIKIDSGDLDDCNRAQEEGYGVGEASIKVLYKIALANNSGKAVRVNRIKHEVNNDLSFTGNVYISSDGNSLGVQEFKYDQDNSIFTLNVDLEPRNVKYVYIEYIMQNTSENRQIIRDRTLEDTLEEKAEILSYSVFSDNTFQETYACIDTDSIPNNKNEDDTEDDTDGIRFGIDIYDHIIYEVNGKVFYDKDYMNVADGGYKIRQGNGKYDTNDGDTGIGNVKVSIEKQIVDIDKTSSDEDKKGDYRFEIPIYDKNKKITHEENFEPYSYFITFTWGTNNGGLDVKDYKGTNVVESDYIKSDWYNNPENPRYSDAIDDWNLRNAMDKNDTTNFNNLTEMNSATNKFPIWNVEGQNYPEIQEDGSVSDVSLPHWTKHPINNIDFGITRRPKQSMEVEKKATNLIIRDASGRILVNATVNDDGSLSGQIAGVTGGPKYVDGKEYLGYIKAEIDNEALSGSTAEVKYKIIVTNTSELDYENSTYYLYRSIDNGEFEGVRIPDNDNDIIKLKPVNIYDYLDKNLTEKTETTKWTHMKQEEVNKEIKGMDSITESYYIKSINNNVSTETLENDKFYDYDMITIDGKIYKARTKIPNGTTIIKGLEEVNSEEMKKYYTKWYYECTTKNKETTINDTIKKAKLDDSLVYKIEEHSIPPISKNNCTSSNPNIIKEELNASSLLANANDIRFDNAIEVREIEVWQGEDSQQLGGIEIEMKLTQLYDESEWISITPPTGENRDYVMIVMVSLSSIIILGAGIVFIKKKVLK